MGVMGVFKWLRKDISQRDRRRSLTPKFNALNNEAYRNALQAFIDRRRNPNEAGCIISPNSPDKERLDFFIKAKNGNEKKKRNDKREKSGMAGIPHIEASEIFEIGWIAGTEDRYMEMVFAEWQSTRVSLRRNTHPDCRDAVKADLDVLTEIRHPNVLLLMATTHTDDHGLVAIFEPVDCTLYNFVHEQGERVSVQGIAKCAGNLAGALKHAHMRGYVHGGISSHCIFLATCGTVKLGGWELSSSSNSQYTAREHEHRLRYEIYKWQAPEIYRGEKPSKATDVYGLALVMWEMCTMNVPWNGLSKSEVERQYVQWEHGVTTDLYDFPPLLNKLLDAGLQLDVSKRSLDMSRMRRFLQTLEIQYEDADPLYVGLLTNNNSPNVIMNESGCPPTDDSPPLPKYSAVPTPKRQFEKKMIDIKRHQPRALNLNLVEEPEKTEEREPICCNQNGAVPEKIYEKVYIPKNVQRVNAKNVNRANPEKSTNVERERNANVKVTQKKIPRVLPMSPELTHTVDSSDDEASSTDLRTNIKKLRQTLANKRNDFFYGSDSSQFSQNDINKKKPEVTKSKILTQIRSKDYEPHKPASHKTSFEPKQFKSTTQYNLTPPRQATHQSKKSPYSYVPTAVRDAVVQPKVLNSDSQSFFESSLWRKEKMICISKMRKNNIDDSTFCISRTLPRSNENNADKSDLQSDETYTIERKAEMDRNTEMIVNDTSIDLTDSSVSRSKSLQALKDSLQRATEIVLSSTTQDETTTVVSSPPKSPDTFEPNNSALNESLFEDLYELKHEGSDGEIQSIERSQNSDTMFFSMENKSDVNEKNVAPPTEIEEIAVRRRSGGREDLKKGSFDPARLSGVVCEPIAESVNENELSSCESKPDDRTVILSRSPVNSQITSDEKLATFELGSQVLENEKQDEHETSFALMIFSDKNRECHSCSPKNLARRRSLPAALGQLRNLSNMSLGKLPIRKGDVPENTVEDIYIDDEFDSLNVNMVLLDDDVTTDDEDFLPDLDDLDTNVYQ